MAFKKALAQGLDMILPPRCPISGEMVDTPGMIAPSAWRGLTFISAPFCKSCGLPFSINVGTDEATCAACLAKPPIYQSARAAVVYDDGCKRLILGFKHADKMHMIRTFTPWLMKAGREMLADADMIVPVPLHRLRLLRRRYNQAAVLAKALSLESGIPCEPQALLRKKATKPQSGDYKKRKKNVSGAFTVNPKLAADITGKTIVLVDDVYTTGSTAKECAKVLMKAGAAGVHVLTLARVNREARLL